MHICYIAMTFYALIFAVKILSTLTEKTLAQDCEDQSRSCRAIIKLCNNAVLHQSLSIQCKKTCGFCADARNVQQSWGKWKDQTSCSKSCGGGTKKQKRKCKNGNHCKGKKKRTVACNTNSCIIKSPTWSSWTTWTECSVSCGQGNRVRYRTCEYGLHCSGNAEEKQTCEATTTCPCTCPDNGSCNDAWPSYCAIAVPESACTNKQAISYHCRKKCGLCNSSCVCGTWSSWTTSSCSNTCGAGIKIKTRTCPEGRVCDGLAQATLACNEKDCFESTMAWSSWGYWSACSATCGSGVRRRTRDCLSSTCHGPSVNKMDCKLQDCLPSDVQSWSSCSKSCGWGTRMKRSCSYCLKEYEDCKIAECDKKDCVQPFYQRYKANTYNCCNGKDTLATACGISATNNGRIVGGSATTSNAIWPWMVQIELNIGTFCGGSLFSNNIVFSAAHCFRNKKYSTATLRFGTITLRDQTSVHVQVRTVLQIDVNVHPGNGMEQDIAIIKLHQAVLIEGLYVRPICLPQGESVPDDTHCVTAGWGTKFPLGFRSPSTYLQDVVVRVLPFEICKKAFPYDVTTSDEMICAGKISGGVDTCRGDSGGPLMCQRCSSCAWFLFGITSFGSRKCGSRGHPGVYTKISYYGTWINTVIGYDVTSGSFSSCTKN